KIGKYKISVNTAANEYMTLFSVEGERGYIACYNGKYQCWVYRRGFGYQDWVTPAFDMSQVDISKLYKTVDERIDLNRTGLDTATLKPISSIPARGGKTTTSTTTSTTTTSSTTTTGKTNTTTTSAGSAPLTGKTSTTTTTETKTPVVRPVIVDTPDESGGWYDDAAEWNTSITSMGPYTISYNIQKGKFALAMISYPGDSAYIGCYDLMYQYWHYRRGYNGYQAAFDPYFDMSQWNTAKLFKKVDASITLDRHVSKGEESLKALSTKIIPYTRSNELDDIGIDGKRFSKTSFVKIPEITIIIGSDKEGVFVSGRSVVLTPYIIGKYEVTQELYEAVTGKNPSKHTSDTPKGEVQKLRPVEKVELFDIAKFCNKLSEMDGLQPVFTISGDTITADITKNGWRIPTEAEWECAARGANPNAKEWKYKYAGTDSEKDATSYMWIKSNSDDTSHEVGLKKPNSLGLYDMLGNVYEWCLDWYDESINKKTMINPIGATSGTERVQRSTAYGSKIGEVTKRDKGKQDTVYIDLGFRLCRTAE
ncbi:MAG: SUMF1/EgtB/PvdO family nonheme iron enzyme, partial [Spirochaetaceae bacterium]|nr:SUMF1/EgtB/PvdO family nonheme iron enzyme [Spirochaetaceae bacterium]